jgi:hypothetical protein
VLRGFDAINYFETLNWTRGGELTDEPRPADWRAERRDRRYGQRSAAIPVV